MGPRNFGSQLSAILARKAGRQETQLKLALRELQMRSLVSVCYSQFRFSWLAKVAELTDAPDLGSGTERCGGSSPPFRTTENRRQQAETTVQRSSFSLTDVCGATSRLNSNSLSEMKSDVKEISSTQKQIDIEIEAKAVKAAYDRISDRYAKAANVPGFRPGHAPRGVVRTRFKDQIRSEVLRELVPDAVQTAIADHKLEPLGEPELDLDTAEGLDPLGDKSISFHVKVEVLPEIRLGKYRSVEVTRRTRPVISEDVDRVIEQLRENSASLQPFEDRGAQPGYTVTAAFHGKFPGDPGADPINAQDVD